MIVFLAVAPVINDGYFARWNWPPKELGLSEKARRCRSKVHRDGMVDAKYLEALPYHRSWMGAMKEAVLFVDSYCERVEEEVARKKAEGT